MNEDFTAIQASVEDKLERLKAVSKSAGYVKFDNDGVQIYKCANGFLIRTLDHKIRIYLTLEELFEMLRRELAE